MGKQLILLIGLIILLCAGAYALDTTTTAANTTTTAADTTTTEIITTTTIGNTTTTLLENVTTTLETTSTSSSTTESTTTTSTTTTTTLACNASQCDTGCIVCSDQKCHDPDFVCKEEIVLEKLFPVNITEGVNQLNILVRNTGYVDLTDIYADLSGDGIVAMDKIPLAALPAGERDYTFSKINATKPGKIDLVVKLVASKRLKSTIVWELNVADIHAAAENTTAAPAFNVTSLSETVKALKEKYFLLEQDYQNKKLEGYYVELILDNLKKTDSRIMDAKAALLEGDLRKANTSLSLAEDNLITIQDQLKNAQKPKVTFSDKVKSNLLLIGSVAAALISIFTAYGLIKSHINKQKLLELQQKIKSKNQKVEQHEEKIEEHDQMLEKQEEKIEETEKKLEATEKKIEKLEENKP